MHTVRTYENDFWGGNVKRCVKPLRKTVNQLFRCTIVNVHHTYESENFGGNLEIRNVKRCVKRCVKASIDCFVVLLSMYTVRTYESENVGENVKRCVKRCVKPSIYCFVVLLSMYTVRMKVKILGEI